jgi:hypothetical protein
MKYLSRIIQRKEIAEFWQARNSQTKKTKLIRNPEYALLLLNQKSK